MLARAGDKIKFSVPKKVLVFAFLHCAHRRHKTLTCTVARLQGRKSDSKLSVADELSTEDADSVAEYVRNEYLPKDGYTNCESIFPGH